jgi:hypothetical protein
LCEDEVDDCALIDALDGDPGSNTLNATASPKPGRRFKPSTRKPGRNIREKRS